MAKIEEIDCEQMITKANHISAAANSMQLYIKEAFQKIDQMREVWYGHSYDNFVIVVNMSISSLNQLFETTVSDIPNEIVAKAKSYALSNQTSISKGWGVQTAIILKAIQKTNKGFKLRFRTSEVSAQQKVIRSKFKEAVAAAQRAKSYASSLESDWRSISGDTNIRELKTAFEKVKKIIENLSDALDRQISAQADTIEALETAQATVKAARKSSRRCC